MINEKDLYDKVSQTLKKNFAGFLSGPDFTRAMKSAELEAFEHFAGFFERTQKIVDALLPFIVTNTITSDASGVVVLPGNFRHHIRLSRVLVSNSTVLWGKPSITYKKIQYAPSNEVEDIMADYIDRPSIAKDKYIYTFENGNIQLYEKNAIDTLLRYIRTPVFGKIVFTPTSTLNGDFNDYDVNASRRLEWPDHVFTLLENLILKQYGVETREQIIQQYAMLESKQYMEMAKIN